MKTLYPIVTRFNNSPHILNWMIPTILIQQSLESITTEDGIEITTEDGQTLVTE